mgnify:CR=1 FL=1
MSKTVLTIDDSRTMRDMLLLALQDAGYTVIQAVDGGSVRVSAPLDPNQRVDYPGTAVYATGQSLALDCQDTLLASRDDGIQVVGIGLRNIADVLIEEPFASWTWRALRHKRCCIRLTGSAGIFPGRWSPMPITR